MQGSSVQSAGPERTMTSVNPLSRIRTKSTFIVAGMLVVTSAAVLGGKATSQSLKELVLPDLAIADENVSQFADGGGTVVNIPPTAKFKRMKCSLWNSSAQSGQLTSSISILCNSKSGMLGSS